MKRVLIRLIIILLLLLIIYWIASIIRCEVLTFQHWKEFEGLEQRIITKSETIKVLEYSNGSATVYYRSRDGGVLFRFIKQDGQWVYDETYAVWARMGSADGFMWPYIR